MLQQNLIFVCDFYKTDLDPQTLQAQLLTFGVEFQQKQSGTKIKPDIFDIKEYFSFLNGCPEISHLKFAQCFALYLSCLQQTLPRNDLLVHLGELRPIYATQ